MANTSCVDSEIFYQKLGEVKASKKTKASKITLFIDDNFYSDTVRWLETLNEDSKDRTNLTSQDVAIIKRKGYNWRVAKYYPQERKRNCSKMSTTPGSLPNPFENCAQRKRQDRQVYQAKLRISSIPRSNTTLCVTLLHDTRRTKVDHKYRQKQPVLAPIQGREFLTHLQMDLIDLRNLPCTCSCHPKHSWILHMIDHFTKYSEEEEDVLLDTTKTISFTTACKKARDQ